MQKLLQIKNNGFTVITVMTAFLIILIMGAGLLGICYKSKIFSARSTFEIPSNANTNPFVSHPTYKAPSKRLHIGSIVYSADMASVVINGRIFHEGDTINDDITVVQIFKDNVIFERKGTVEPKRWTQKK